MKPEIGRDPMRFDNLDDWLAWQERLHPSAIDLGLERPGAVLDRLGGAGLGVPVITVAGTNGKGSCVALLEAILTAAGYRVGAYTSPHLVRYNERIRIDGAEATDADLCAAFDRVDRARDETSLTYFEFGTLAALDLFRRADVDVVLLEVGLGGRLDAVNLVAADAALVTTVDLDHIDWLGPDREAVAREKAGIFRHGRPAVYGDLDPPAAVGGAAKEAGAPLALAGRDYTAEVHADGTWDYRSPGWTLRNLPAPGLEGTVQYRNAAAVLAVLERLRDSLPLDEPAVRQGLPAAWLAGRLQVIPGPVPQLLDVAHNPQAAAALAGWLRDHPVAGRTHAVLAMLRDKDIAGVVSALVPAVDAWYLAPLDLPRGAAVAELEAALVAAGVEQGQGYANVEQARAAALAAAGSGDRVVITGSFHTAAAVLAGCTEG